MSWSKRIAFVCVGLSLAVVACVPPDTEPDLSREFDENTRMGEIQASGSLRIGIPTGSAPFASEGERGPRGFTVDLGRLVADTLGVKPRFSVGPFEVLRGRLEQEELDIAFSLEPLTEDSFRKDPYSDPYYVGHQRLLVPDGSQLGGTQDMSGARVCSYLPDVGVDVAELATDVRVTHAFSPAECVRMLAGERVDAITAQDVWLVEAMTEFPAGSARRYSIVGDQLSTEGYGIAAAPGAGTFIEYLNSLLREAEEDGMWARSYERWLAPYLGERAVPPDLSAEEAASLYPAEP